MNYDLSICVPGIRNQNWVTLFNQMKLACKKYTWEMIFCGPNPLPPELHPIRNVKYIKDFGTPTRTLHLATLISEGKYLTWFADDGWVYEDATDQAMDALIHEMNPAKDLIAMRYQEGEGHNGIIFPNEYWTAGYHDDLHVANVKPEWKQCGILLLASDYYRWLGMDCRFWHINMNIHDLAFRAQANGSIVRLSPSTVVTFDYESGRTPQNSKVIAAFYDNDRPLFREIYSTIRPIQIDDNWRETTKVVWE